MRHNAKLPRKIDPECLGRLLMRIEIDPESGCWQVRGARPSRPFRLWVGRESMYGHRYIYESLVGMILPGLVIDHLCRNRGCLNPLHMEPTTVEENTRRGAGLTNRTKTHCIHGHPLSGENLYLRYDRGGGPHRHCKACLAVNSRAYRERKKQLARPEAGNLIGAIDDHEPVG